LRDRLRRRAIDNVGSEAVLKGSDRVTVEFSILVDFPGTAVVVEGAGVIIERRTPRPRSAGEDALAEQRVEDPGVRPRPGQSGYGIARNAI
jgi:hypothetical protein